MLQACIRAGLGLEKAHIFGLRAWDCHFRLCQARPKTKPDPGYDRVYHDHQANKIMGSLNGPTLDSNPYTMQVCIQVGPGNSSQHHADKSTALAPSRMILWSETPTAGRHNTGTRATKATPGCSVVDSPPTPKPRGRIVWPRAHRHRST